MILNVIKTTKFWVILATVSLVIYVLTASLCTDAHLGRLIWIHFLYPFLLNSCEYTISLSSTKSFCLVRSLLFTQHLNCAQHRIATQYLLLSAYTQSDHNSYVQCKSNISKVSQSIIIMHSTNSTDTLNWFVPASGSKSNGWGRLHSYHDLISVRGLANV